MAGDMIAAGGGGGVGNAAGMGARTAPGGRGMDETFRAGGLERPDGALTLGAGE